jgi:hypothetical protein
MTLFIGVKWTTTARYWLKPACFLRAVRYEDAGVVLELSKAHLPGVAFAGTSVWRDAEGGVWVAHRTEKASDVLAVWVRRENEDE